MKTKIDIIEETVAFYSEDTSRRSMQEGQGYVMKCLYRNPEGKKCALGRCLTEESLDMLAEESLDMLAEESLDMLAEEYYNSKTASAILKLPWVKLKPEYAHIVDVDFWEDLQNLHDEEKNWDENGLTQEGKQLIDALKADYQ